MRVYFEKPRTSIGWKGLINDPHLNNSYDINTGLANRTSAVCWTWPKWINLPAATELLDPNHAPIYRRSHYLDCDRRTGPQKAKPIEKWRLGLSMPIGFKNNTDGSLAGRD